MGAERKLSLRHCRALELLPGQLGVTRALTVSPGGVGTCLPQRAQPGTGLPGGRPRHQSLLPRAAVRLKRDRVGQAQHHSWLSFGITLLTWLCLPAELGESVGA